MTKLKDYKPTDKVHFRELIIDKKNADAVIKINESLETYKNACREFEKIYPNCPKIKEICEQGIIWIDEWHELFATAIFFDLGKKVSVQ